MGAQLLIHGHAIDRLLTASFGGLGSDPTDSFGATSSGQRMSARGRLQTASSMQLKQNVPQSNVPSLTFASCVVTNAAASAATTPSIIVAKGRLGAPACRAACSGR